MENKCEKCKGTGWYQYSTTGTPHSTICDVCCKHDKGYWLLGDMYANAGKLCCLAGCGTTKEDDGTGIKQPTAGEKCEEHEEIDCMACKTSPNLMESPTAGEEVVLRKVRHILQTPEGEDILEHAWKIMQEVELHRGDPNIQNDATPICCEKCSRGMHGICVNPMCSCHVVNCKQPTAGEKCEHEMFAKGETYRCVHCNWDSKVSTERKPESPTVPAGWEKEFDDDFFYRQDGLWGHWVDACDEDDKPLDRVRAYMVPEAIKSFISSQISEAEKRGAKQALESLREALPKCASIALDDNDVYKGSTCKHEMGYAWNSAIAEVETLITEKI